MSASFSDLVYADYGSLYGQPLNIFARQVDSLQDRYPELLERHAAGLPRPFIFDDSLGTVYFFDRLILEYPSLHFDFTGDSFPLNQQLSGRLRAHGANFDRYAYLENRDLRAYVASFLRLGIDPNRILATGKSSGGHLALATALAEASDTARFTAMPNAMVVIAGVYDLTVDNARWIQRAAPLVKQVKIFLRFKCWQRSSPPPSLLLHGSNDRNCPYATALEFSERADKDGLPVDLHTV
ncbi:MAG: prolyl oligopeptidase family serine peptidase [Lewinella sp.]